MKWPYMCCPSSTKLLSVELGDVNSGEGMKKRRKMVDWINNAFRWRPSLIFYLGWTALNVWIFWNTYRQYKGRPQYFYLHRMLGSGLCISRGSGAVLNVSSGLILLPACKKVTTVLSRWTGRHHRLWSWLFNQAGRLHVTCAVTIVIASVIHTGAHVMNAINFSRHYEPVWKEINMADYAGQDPFLLVITTVPGVTGLLMGLFLLVMVLTSGRWFRSRYFNVFYLSHNVLFAPFLLLLVFHPFSGVLKEQVNWKDHRPGRDADDDGSSRPIFVSMPTHTWLWVSIPLAAYAADWASRRLARRRVATLAGAVHHGMEENVLELALHRRWISGKSPLPGQYVLIQCPAVSGFEWHPFSLSSCSDVTHPCWTVHLKTGGDWCSQLKEVVTTKDQVELYVDGPFASPLEGVLRSRTAICIAGGIGFTPFLSVVHHLIRNGWPDESRPDRLHLVWCVKTAEGLSWAAKAIDRLIEDAWASRRPDKLEIRLFVTRQKEAAAAGLGGGGGNHWDSIRAHQEQAARRSLLGNDGLIRGDPQHCSPNILRRIEFGRPDWADLFARWRETYPSEQVNVFTCGPKRLSGQIERVCRGMGGNFTLTRENFS